MVSRWKLSVRAVPFATSGLLGEIILSLHLIEASDSVIALEKPAGLEVTRLKVWLLSIYTSLLW